MFSPGRYIEEELTARGVAFEEWRLAMGLTIAEQAALLRGITPLTPLLARKLARYFGTTPSLWLNLEREYRKFNPAVGR